MSSARNHIVYYHLLRDSLYLHEFHAWEIEDVYKCPREKQEELMIRSAPGFTLYYIRSLNDFPVTTSYAQVFEGKLLTTQTGWPFGVTATARMFDFQLYGVPGFFVTYKDLEKPSFEMGWRLNVSATSILKPYMGKDNRILGLFVYRDVRDEEPLLLSSKGLFMGAPAVLPLPETSRRLA